MQPSIVSSAIEPALIEPAAAPASEVADVQAFLTVAPEQRPAILAITPPSTDQPPFAHYLEASGYEVYTSNTAPEALDQAEQIPLDVIVLDLDGYYVTSQDGLMISGFRLLYLLHRLIGERPIAVMVVTESDYAEVEGAVCAHADALVNKPVTPGQLIARLRVALERVRCRCQQRLDLPRSWQPAGGSGSGQG